MDWGQAPKSIEGLLQRQDLRFDFGSSPQFIHTFPEPRRSAFQTFYRLDSEAAPVSHDRIPFGTSLVGRWAWR